MLLPHKRGKKYIENAFSCDIPSLKVNKRVLAENLYYHCAFSNLPNQWTIRSCSSKFSRHKNTSYCKGASLLKLEGAYSPFAISVIKNVANITHAPNPIHNIIKRIQDYGTYSPQTHCRIINGRIYSLIHLI
mgnify:CR=1 FL=1